jgi:hypothetical protein
MVKVTGAKQFGRQLRANAEFLRAESAKLLKMHARLLASEYGAKTAPQDAFGAAAVEGYKANILKESRYIFPTREDTGKVYELIKQRDPALAAAYYHAAKSGKTSAAAAILRKSGIPQGNASPSAIKAARTGKKRSIPARAHPPVSLLRTSESRRLARLQQDTVGTAKAGWHQAAKALGGRNRSNYAEEGVKRSTAERFPAYVRLVSRRTPDLGGARVSDDSVAIWTNVTHAREALDSSFQASAESDAEEKLHKALLRMIAAVEAKFNKRAVA